MESAQRDGSGLDSLLYDIRHNITAVVTLFQDSQTID